MVKKKFSLFLIASLVLSILTVLPGVSATPARPYTGASGLFDFIETCIGNSCDLIESCRSQAHTKTVAVEKEAIECFAEPGDPTPRGCYGITAKWNNHWSGGDSYVPDTDGWADDYFRAFTSECEAAKPQEAAETELQAAADEENELQAEMDLLLNEIADICVGIEGCKPGDRESPGYFNDIINSIIKLHSDSCDKGQCIKVPIDELINLADRIVDWNQREAAWESKFNGLTPEPIETKVRDVNPGILTNLYTNLNTNLKEEISKPSEQDHIAAKQVDLNKNEIFNQLNDAFTEKGKISAEQVASAIKSYEAKLNAGQGEKINVALPKGSSIQNIEAITARSLQDATMTVTVIDEVALNKAVPLLGGKGIIGNPDYPIPRAPLGPPEAGKYSVKEYFSVENSMSADANPLVPFYEKTWFKFSLESSVEAAKNTVLLRYNKDTNKWNPLPTQHILSVAPTGLYEFTAESPGTSYFAIVVENLEAAQKDKKETESTYGTLFWWSFIILSWLAVLFFYLKVRKKDEYNQLMAAKSMSGKIAVLSSVKLRKYAFGLRVLFFSAIMEAALIIFGFIEGILKFSPFTSFIIIILAYFAASLIVGSIFGLATWILLKVLSKLFKK